MKCANHLDRDALAVCNRCGKSVCNDCFTQMRNEVYCSDCATLPVGQGQKTEHTPSLAAVLSFIIPGLGQFYNGQTGKGLLIFFFSWLIFPWIIGIFEAYNTAKKIKEGAIAFKPKTGCLIGFIVGVVAFTFLTFFLAMLAAIAIPNFLRARLAANESYAEATVKNISAALESYKAANNNLYPIDEGALLKNTPPYLSSSFQNQNIKGYAYTETLQADSYTIIARPTTCGSSGEKVFVAETGGVLRSEKCVPSQAN